ncbi:MAG: DUF1643 domain-containing protein [Pseudomonadota bacterium]
MIEEHHSDRGIESHALWSRCRRYRFRLSRRWAPGEQMLFVMLNPSRATAAANDPTIARCQERAARLGFAGFTACNLFAWCATDPADLKRAARPVGQGTDRVLEDAAQGAALVLCAWGVHGAHRGRGARVARLLSRVSGLYVLGLTKDGHPRHPLYVGYAAAPVLWVP